MTVGKRRWRLTPILSNLNFFNICNGQMALTFMHYFNEQKLQKQSLNHVLPSLLFLIHAHCSCFDLDMLEFNDS